MSQIKIGNLSLSNAYLGEKNIKKIYLGENLIFSTEELIKVNLQQEDSEEN